MRYALRVDANQTAVRSALTAAGYQVEVIGKPLDLQVGNPATGEFLIMEVKVPGGSKTKFQDGYFERWGGYKAISLVDSPESALRHARLVLGDV